MSSPALSDNDRFIPERNSAFTIGVLHVFVVFAAAALLWNSPVVTQRNLLFWMAGEVVLSLVSFASFAAILRRQVGRFVFFSQVESLGTAFSFSAFAWLGDDMPTATPSKHVLMIALIAVTSIAAANSSHITRRRPFFDRLIVIVAVNYSIAFALHQEWVFAALSALWCLSIAVLTRVGYDGMQELLALRAASEQNARHDDLTGLLSRSAFFELLRNQKLHAISDATPDDTLVALVLFDLDGFKAINDAYGHVAGDEVLRSVASRLNLFLPESAVIGRLGGDEFAAIVHAEEQALTQSVEGALAAVAEPIKFDERELYVAASAGWTEVTRDGVPAELMAQADAAMYQSKNSQTAVSTGFNTALRNELDRSLELRQRFRSALKRGEIEFWAQPLVRTSDSAPVAVELLARWPQDDDTIVGPLEFTRVADETGLAVELDRLAVAAARALLEEWKDDPLLRSITVKANISPVHLHNNQLIQTVQDLVPLRTRERLGLEFVESRLIPAAERNHDQLRSLMDMGITISIDDFGVGYSSLAYLRTLPVSEIKIDRSFVTNVDTDTINQGLVRAIVDIASTLGLPTVAEGVETEAEFNAIARLGVSAGQGYLLGRPLPLASTPHVLRELQESAASLQP